MPATDAVFNHHARAGTSASAGSVLAICAAPIRIRLNVPDQV